MTSRSKKKWTRKFVQESSRRTRGRIVGRRGIEAMVIIR